MKKEVKCIMENQHGADKVEKNIRMLCFGTYVSMTCRINPLVTHQYQNIDVESSILGKNKRLPLLGNLNYLLLFFYMFMSFVCNLKKG